jgi:hypothetical protein
MLPTPWDEIDVRQRVLLTARISLWRREHVEGIHLLRSTLDRDPHFAEAWAMLGEFFLHIARLEEGVQAYERAVADAPEDASYAARLQHVRAALAGTVELQIEISPEEEMLIEERRQRKTVTSAILALAIFTLFVSFVLPLRPNPEALYVPWRAVIIQAIGMFLVFLALSYGRLLQPFEHVMLWSGMRAGDRGTIRNYPYALILLVATVPSMWFAFVALLIIAFMDEEWPVSPTIMLGACVLVNLLLVYFVFMLTGHAHWSGTLLVGGNALVLTAMLGWWLGSLGSMSYS